MTPDTYLVQFVLHADVPAFEADGWRDEGPVPGPHGCWSAFMTKPNDGAPPLVPSAVASRLSPWPVAGDGLLRPAGRTPNPYPTPRRAAFLDEVR